MPTQALRDYLAADPALARLAQGVAAAKALDRRLQGALPPELKGRVHAAELKRGCLLIVAENGPTASKLQQMSRTIIARLGESGVQLESLLVRIAPADAQRAAPRAASLSPEAGKLLEASAKDLPAGGLRDALERLARRR